MGDPNEWASDWERLVKQVSDIMAEARKGGRDALVDEAWAWMVRCHPPRTG